MGSVGQWLVKPFLGLVLATTLVPLLGLPHAVGTGLILVRASCYLAGAVVVCYTGSCTEWSHALPGSFTRSVCHQKCVCLRAPGGTSKQASTCARWPA